MKPIHILTVINTLNIGGAEKQLLNLIIRTTRDHNLLHTVVTLRSGGVIYEELKKAGISVHSLDMKTLSHLPVALHRLKQLIAANNIDLIHSHFALSDIAAWGAGKKLNLPVVITKHSLFEGWYPGIPLLHRLYRQVLSSAEKIIAVSHTVKHYLITTYSVMPENIAVISNCPGSVTGNSKTPHSFRTRFNIPASAPILGTVSRLEAVKGIDCFVRTAATVRRSRPDVYFAIAGDGTQRQALKKMASRLGIAHHLVFTGYITDIEEVLPAFDIFFLPTRSEGFGLAVLEALSFGKPVVASRTGNIPALVHDGINGFLCQIDDDACFAERLLSLLEDGTRRDTMGKQSRLLFEKFLRGENSARHITALYREALTKKGANPNIARVKFVVDASPPCFLALRNRKCDFKD